MNIWRLQLKVKSTNHNYRDLLDFCIKNNVIGVGWKLKEKHNDYNKLKAEIAKHNNYGTGALKAINALRKMEVDDLIWTRLGDDASEYYLFRVTKKWIDCPDILEFADFDISNYVYGQWIKIGSIDKVPGKVISSLCARSTVQKVNGVEDISKIIWNKYSLDNNYKYSITKLSKDSFWDMIDSEELECLILLYLQCEKNYYVYSSTIKNSTPKYQCH